MTQHDNETQIEEQQTADGNLEPDDVAPQQDSDNTEAQADLDDEPDPRNAEAAKWRHRAKDNATGLDAANLLLDDYKQREQVLQRQVVNAHIAHAFADPSDFHRDVQLADLVGEDGAVDLGRVDEAAQRVLADHPHYRRNAYAPTAVPASVVTTDTPPTVTPGGAKPTWRDVLAEGNKM